MFCALFKAVRDLVAADHEGFNAVIHRPPCPTIRSALSIPDITCEINHQGSVDIAGLAKQAGVPRFLFASSRSNYGRAGDER